MNLVNVILMYTWGFFIMNAMLNDGNINEYNNGSDNNIGNRKVVIVMM